MESHQRGHQRGTGEFVRPVWVYLVLNDILTIIQVDPLPTVLDSISGLAIREFAREFDSHHSELLAKDPSSLLNGQSKLQSLGLAVAVILEKVLDVADSHKFDLTSIWEIEFESGCTPDITNALQLNQWLIENDLIQVREVLAHATNSKTKKGECLCSR